MSHASNLASPPPEYGCPHADEIEAVCAACQDEAEGAECREYDREEDEGVDRMRGVE